MNKKIKILLISILMFIAMAIFNSGVQAASGDISANNYSVTVGDKVTITVTINGASWNLNLSGAVQNSYVEVTDDGGNTTKTYTTSFTPSSAGDYNVTLKGTVTDTDLVTKANVDKTITIKATKKEEETPPAKSDNANLKNLGIRPNDFKGFKANQLSYDVKVPNNVDKVEVYAVKADEKATVTGTGSKSLKVGKNVLSVEVTAEDGTTKKTYTINVTREEKTETNETSNETTNQVSNETVENTTVDGSTTIDYDLTKLEVKGYTITPKFSPDVYEYKLNLTDTSVTELEIITQGASDDVQIDVVGNTDLKDGENIITILVHNEKTKEDNTYQIIVNKNAINLDEVDAALSKNIEKVNLVRGILLGVIVFIVLSEIVFIVVCYRKRKQMKEQEYEDDKYAYEEDDEEEDYTKHIFNKDKEEHSEDIDDSNDETTTQDEVRKVMKETDEVIDETVEKANTKDTDKNNADKDYDIDDNYRRNKGKGKHF